MNLNIVKSATKELEDARLVVEAAEAKLRAVVNDKGPTVTLTPKGAAAVAKVGRRKPAGPRGPKAKRPPTLTPPPEKTPKAPRKPARVAEESVKRVEEMLFANAPMAFASDTIAEQTGLRTPIVRLAIGQLGAKVETIGRARATKYRWAGVSAGGEE